MIVTTPHQPEPEKYPGGIAFGTTIRWRRIRAGLTLRKCAEACGMTLTELSAVEQGQRALTGPERFAYEVAVKKAMEART